MSNQDWMTITDIISKYPFKEGTVRRIMNERKKNGLAKYVKKIGKFLYIKDVDFNLWIDEQKEE